MSGLPFCHVCKKYFNSIEQKTAHEKGAGHLSKVKALEDQSNSSITDSFSNMSVQSCDNSDGVRKVTNAQAFTVTPRTNFSLVRPDSSIATVETLNDPCGTPSRKLNSRLEQCGASATSVSNSDIDEAPSFFIRSCDIPDDVPSLSRSPIHPAQSEMAPKPDASPYAYNNFNINRPRLYDTTLPQSQAQQPVATPSDIRSIDPENRSETSFDDNNLQGSNIILVLREGNGTDFIYDFVTKTGVCYVCKNTKLSSERQAVDHIISSGHKRKKKLMEGLPNLSLPRPAAGPIQPSQCDKASKPDASPSAYNVLNRPRLYHTILPQPQAQQRVANTADIWSVDPENRSETSFDDNNLQGSKIILVLREGNGTDFIYDFATQTGVCYVCKNTKLSSERQAFDHIISSGHKRRKKQESELPNLGLSQPAARRAAGASPSLSANHAQNPLLKANNIGNVQEPRVNNLSCDVCNTTFTCEKDKENHSKGQRHMKELRKREIAQKERATERQASMSDEVEQTKKKGLLETGQQTPTNDEDKTIRKELYQAGASFPTDEVLNSQDQTQVKVSPSGIRPTAVVSRSPIHPAQSEMAPKPDAFSSDCNDLNRPMICDLTLPQPQAQQPVATPSDIRSIVPENRSETSFDDNNLQGSNIVLVLREGNGTDFIYDFATQTGVCYVCKNTKLSSERQAVDHIVSSGHKRRKKQKSELPNLGLSQPVPRRAAGASPSLSANHAQNPLLKANNIGNVQEPRVNNLSCDVCNTTFTCEKDKENHSKGQRHMKELRKREIAQKERATERQASISDEFEQTRKKGLLETGQQTPTNDEDKTIRKELYQAGASFPADEVLNSQDQTQVKVSPSGVRPTAVVSPRQARPTSSGERGGRESNSNPENNTSTATNASVPPSNSTSRSNSYCETYRLPLTSPEHADDHYAGRRHAREVERQRRRGEDADRGRTRVTVSINVDVQL